jgi:hypothetical protein
VVAPGREHPVPLLDGQRVALRDGHEQELRDVRADVVARERPPEQRVDRDRAVGRPRPVVAGRGGEFGGRPYGQRVRPEVVEGDVPEQRLPVEFDHLGGALFVRERRGGCHREVVRVGTGEVVRQRGLRVHEPTLAAERDGLEVGLAGQCREQGVVGRRVDGPVGVVREPLRERGVPVGTVAGRLRRRPGAHEVRERGVAADAEGGRETVAAGGPPAGRPRGYGGRRVVRRVPPGDAECREQAAGREAEQDRPASGSGPGPVARRARTGEAW